jgi:hypothetical protein
MNLQRVGTWQWLTGLAGLVLLVDLWLPWFGAGGVTGTAWESFAFIDLILALTGLAALALVLVTASQPAAALPKRFAAVVMWLAIVASLFTLYRLLKLPDADIALIGGADEVVRKAGVFIGLIAAIATAVFAWRAAHDARFPGPLREHPHAETLPPPAAEESRRRV